jgi:hypothetical protein
MSSQFSLSIPEAHWKPITDEHKDGRLVWIRGEVGNVDLARWDRGEWNCELGSVEDPTEVAAVSLQSTSLAGRV